MTGARKTKAQEEKNAREALWAFKHLLYNVDQDDLSTEAQNKIQEYRKYIPQKVEEEYGGPTAEYFEDQMERDPEEMNFEEMFDKLEP